MNKIAILIKSILSLFISQAIAQEVTQEMGVGGWEILRDGQWEEKKWHKSEKGRIWNAQELYEELDRSKPIKLTLPKKRIDPYGLKIKNCYLVWDKGWYIIDNMLNRKADVKLFYAPERKWCRQFTFDQFLKFSYPHHRSQYIWVDFPGGLKFTMDKRRLESNFDKDIYSFSFGELGGYGICIQDFRNATSFDEAIEFTQTILEALNGQKKYAYYPKRAEGLHHLRYPKQVNREVVSQFNKDMRKQVFERGDDDREDANKYVYINDEAERLLNMDSIYPERKDNEPNFPPSPIKVGTREWIKKHIQEPFNVDYEDTKDLPYYAIGGKFIIEQNNQEYPIKCEIKHLLSKAQAIDVMIYMQVFNNWGRPRDIELMIFFHSILHFRPGLVGDYDVCLKPVLNDFGQTIQGSEHTWISFVRGNTVVTLRDRSMTISVLPIAQKIDKALKAAYDKINAPEIMK